MKQLKISLLWNLEYAKFADTDATEWHPLMIEAWVEVMIKNYHIFPVFAYEHEEKTYTELSLIPFSCLWSSGQVGYIVVSREIPVDRVKILAKDILQDICDRHDGRSQKTRRSEDRRREEVRK